MTHPDKDLLDVRLPRSAVKAFTDHASERANLAWRTAGNPAANRSQRTRAREEAKYWDSVVECLDNHTRAVPAVGEQEPTP